jgi:hypothetical protein
MLKFTTLSLAACLGALALFSQETRSTLLGRALDSQGAVVAGVKVTVTNTDTGASQSLTTNQNGYYEANLLLPGPYRVSAEAKGFKKSIRTGVILPVSSRIEVDLNLEIGQLSETVSVTADAPLLETSSVSSGRVIDNKTVMELPIMGNSAMLLVKNSPGIQSSGVNNYLALHSNAGGSDYSVGGNIGGNSWTLDGSPNQGPGRRTAYLPYTDAISEFKVETNNYDASIGQTSGAAITMISKSGSNDFHGTATWQHWQQRWQGTPFFVKQTYYRNIAAAEAAGNTARANELRNTDKQPTGRSNNWGASGGGPVVIPKIFNGRNKLFWFFTYNAFKDVKVEDASTFNRTVPTLNAREGIFTDMLSLPNANRFVIHDPITIARDPARPNNFIRQPFPNNVIPKSRFANPAFDKIMSLYPKPNNTIPGQDPTNNYLANQTPYNWDYKAYSNRVDYNINDRWRMYGRWSWNNFGPEDRSDWTYETARGLNLNGLVRNNIGGNIDLVYTRTANTIFNFNLASNQFKEGNIQPFARTFKPSDLGLPAYLDQKAGDEALLPLMNLNGYSQISPGGLPTFTKTRSINAKFELTHIRGKHTIRAAFDKRNYFRTGGGGGNTSGNFTFSDTFTRRYDDGFFPSATLVHSMAAFILGIPNGISIATNDNYATHTPYWGTFVQDSWRLTKRLTINLGARIEWEGGATERYNRFIGGFDPTLSLPLSDAVQAAYARNPVAELPASQFKVLGGALYPGTGSNPRSGFKNEVMFMPRIGVAYMLNDRTVIRGGYGMFFDTINVMNFAPDQTGYSRSTSTIITNDFGQTWNFPANANPGNGNSPLRDPFPVRADGTRFDVPTRDALGIMARAGRNFDFTPFSLPHARQQRWSLGFQRQLGATMQLNVMYQGSYSDRVSLTGDNVSRRLSALPGNYWADGLTRNDAIANNLNANVPNPFFIGNLDRSKFDPLVWQDMSNNGFFTSNIIRRHQLIRPFSLYSGGNGLRNFGDGDSYTRADELQVSFDKRFSKGWNLNFGYTAMRLREADFFINEFDAERTERPSNDGRPHRIVASAIYELPFGKGRSFLNQAPALLNHLIGGWQTAVTYEWQPGPLLDWGGNIFYRGSDTANIADVNRTFDTWFNTANFERNSLLGPNSFHRRQFPTRVPGIRADMTNQWNANVSKSISISERVNMQLRLDALNVANRSQMAGANTDPYSTNFGRVLSQTSATNRWIQVQARLTF